MLVMSGTSLLYHLQPAHQTIVRPAIARLAASDPQIRRFPLYDSRISQCGVDWQDGYKTMHKDIVSGHGPQRFAVAVGVEAGLTGVHSLILLSLCEAGLAAVTVYACKASRMLMLMVGLK